MCKTSPTTSAPSFFFGLPVASLSEEIKEQRQLPALKQHQSVELHLDTIGYLDDSIAQLSSFKSMAPLKRQRTVSDSVLNNKKSSSSSNSNKHSQLRRRALRAMELAAEQNDEQQQQQKICSTDTTSTSTSSDEERVQVRFAPTLVTQLWEPDNYIDDANRTNLFYSNSEMKQFKRDAIEAECKAEAERVQREIAVQFENDFVWSNHCDDACDELQAEYLLCADISSRNVIASTAA
mmetsp:Transcript_16700/g.36236  ORF Transcript_16700/g.36236 Transcript_16700/m.36236 type:complete len:236 (+) Transcript_16700:478-1185(+)|eukprot:CAMPEP_0178499928 /NCGR_PEP_ID=MMETSP0696-20121128/16095_1 /TAXON_ID=265572 /ORGANISM="Extubocellulus spinifer, Strain CCMP396" /LENGTH=235 /DNA_ID=CAMNT_0020128677 /DNA_START=353 /DNA_END=1060 /DNA_ORIENTATION=-